MMTSRRADHEVGSLNQRRCHVITQSPVTCRQPSKSYRASATGDTAASLTSQHITLRQYGGGELTASGTTIATGSQCCLITIGNGRVESRTRNMLRLGTSLPSFTCLVSLLFVILLLPVSESLKTDVIADVTGLSLQRQQAAASIGRVVKLSPCRAIIDERVVNLQPLQSTDGSPRFMLQLDDRWKFSFNPCVSYNLPTNPLLGSGDQCHYVAACKYRDINSTVGGASVGEFYTLGLQHTLHFQLTSSVNGAEGTTMTSTSTLNIAPVAHISFQSMFNQTELPDNKTEIPGNSPMTNERSTDDILHNDHSVTSQSTPEIKPVLVLRGIRSMKRRKVFISLICDYSRHDVNDAMFKMAATSPSNNSLSHYHFELHHRCCCPDGCPINLLPEGVSEGLQHHGNKQSVTVVKSEVVNKDSVSSEQLSKSLYSLDVATTVSSPFNSDSEPRSRSAGPRFLWIILVVNGSIILSAVLVAAVCCRRGGGLMATGPYTYIPALHASRGTVNSVDPRSQMTGIKSSIKSMGGLGMSVGLGSTQVVSGGGIGGGVTAGTVPGPGPISADYRDYSVATAPSSRLPQLDNCVISSHALEIGQRLGGGLFGDTYLGEWKSRNVAAKRITVGIHQTQTGASDLEWIVDRVSLLSKQRHANLAAVIGVCLDMKQPYVITEFIDGESLRDVIRRAAVTPDSSFNWPSKIKVCIQVADGMAFLHSAKRPILHRDLRSANVIVDKNGKVKIVDYGLTRIIQRLRNDCDRGLQCYCRKELSALPASIRWTAPEVLTSPRSSEDNIPPVQPGGVLTELTSALTPSCDVYSFAMVLWELATCTDPFEDIAEENQVVQLVLDGTRPPVETIPRGTVPHFKDLMKRCWDQSPESRPQFKQVALYLKNILQVVNKLSAQQPRDRSDSIHSTTTSIYLRSVFNVGLDN